MQGTVVEGCLSFWAGHVTAQSIPLSTGLSKGHWEELGLSRSTTVNLGDGQEQLAIGREGMQ